MPPTVLMSQNDDHTFYPYPTIITSLGLLKRTKKASENIYSVDRVLKLNVTDFQEFAMQKKVRNIYLFKIHLQAVFVIEGSPCTNTRRLSLQIVLN